MNIYQLSEEYMFLMQDVEEAEGELTPELEERLQINKEDFQNKMDAYAAIKAMKEGEIGVIDDEINRLTELKASKTRLIEKLKGYMLIALTLWGETGKSGNKKFETTLHKFWNVYHKPLVIDNEEKVPTEFCKYTMSDKLTDLEMEKMCDILASYDIHPTFDSTIDRKELKAYVAGVGETTAYAHIDTKASYIVVK